MTVSSQTNKVIYIGNGVATEFAIPFSFLEKEHIKVRQKKNDIQTERTDWTVKSGNLVFADAPESGAEIAIVREVPLTQETDYRDNEILHAETLERNFDKLTMQVQQLAEKSERAVTVDLFSDVKPANLVNHVEAVYTHLHNIDKAEELGKQIAGRIASDTEFKEGIAENRIPNVKQVRTGLVTTDSIQNIKSSTKTVTSNTPYSRFLQVKNTELTDTDIPPEKVCMEVSALCGNYSINEYLGSVGFARNTSGSQETYLRCSNSASGVFKDSVFRLVSDISGQSYMLGPTAPTALDYGSTVLTAATRKTGYTMGVPNTAAKIAITWGNTYTIPANGYVYYHFIGSTVSNKSCLLKVDEIVVGKSDEVINQWRFDAAGTVPVKKGSTVSYENTPTYALLFFVPCL